MELMQQLRSQWGLHSLPIFLLCLVVLVHEAVVLMVAVWLLHLQISHHVPGSLMCALTTPAPPPKAKNKRQNQEGTRLAESISFKKALQEARPCCGASLLARESIEEGE